MIFTYEKLLKENNLTFDELPQDIKIGIKAIKGQERAINMREKGGKNVSENQLNKIKREDKNVCKDIQEYITEKGKQNGGANNNAQTSTSQSNQTGSSAVSGQSAQNTQQGNQSGSPAAPSSSKEGDAIDKELTALIKDGKTSLTGAELKSSAPKTYSVIFESYKKGESNGVETSHYSCIEKGDETFVISKL